MSRDHWILLAVLGCALLLAALDLARFDADPIETAMPVAFRDEPHGAPVGPAAALSVSPGRARP